MITVKQAKQLFRFYPYRNTIYEEIRGGKDVEFCVRVYKLNRKQREALQCLYDNCRIIPITEIKRRKKLQDEFDIIHQADVSKPVKPKISNDDLDFSKTLKPKDYARYLEVRAIRIRNNNLPLNAGVGIRNDKMKTVNINAHYIGERQPYEYCDVDWNMFKFW